MKTSKTITDNAIQQVEDNADALWLWEAELAVEFVASRNRYFTSDDIWKILETSPREPRALGAVLRRAQASGVIEPTDTWTQSTRSIAHRRPLRVWKSLR